MLNSFSDLFQQAPDGERHRAPALLLALESTKTVLGDLINPRPAFVGGDYPAGLDEVRRAGYSDPSSTRRTSEAVSIWVVMA
jgi:hypothetical protein